MDEECGCPYCVQARRAAAVAPIREPGPLLTFSLAYIDSVMAGESAEAQRHWTRVREAAAGVKGPEHG